MRIICLVPSITETLVECGVDIVGRTRFCIHPVDTVKNITSVAGTKDINWDKVKKLKPDLVILDKEENTLEMAETCPYPYIALHITGVDNVGDELNKLALKIDSLALKQIAVRWSSLAQRPAKSWSSVESIPGILAFLPGSDKKPLKSIKHIDYMIWKQPWMAIGPNTFIWSVLKILGFSEYLINREDKYPNLGENLKPDDKTLYLFSSEPYPFERYQRQLAEEGFHGAIIDGECYSWYGLRSLRFLETQLSSS